MKYTVNRRFYDTEAADKLAEIQKSFGEYGKNPDNDWTESLYKKPNGEYFVHGKRGKNSPFAENKEGRNQAGSRAIVWRTENESNAKLWVHDNVPGKFDEIFITNEYERQ